MATNNLTVAAIRHAKPGKMFDGGGLFLLTKVTGAQLWRMKYRYGGKERLLSFGAYPEVTLAEARARRDEARVSIRDGADPGAIQRARKAAAKLGNAESFRAVAGEWLAKQRASLVPTPGPKGRKYRRVPSARENKNAALKTP